VYTSQLTQCSSIRKTNHLVLCWEAVAVYCENHTDTYTLSVCLSSLSISLFLPTGCTVHARPWPPSGSISRRLYPWLFFFQPLTPILFRSFTSSSNHLFLGFPRDLFPSGMFLNIFCLQAFFPHVLTIAIFLF